MLLMGSRCIRAAMVSALVVVSWMSLARADERSSIRNFGKADGGIPEVLAPDTAIEREQRLLAALVGPRSAGERRRRKKLDLTPLVERAVQYLQGTGLPLIEHRDEQKDGRIAFSASFSISENSPDITLSVGKRSIEPFGAFFPDKKGLRWSIVCPVSNLTFRVEGGDDSEFGSIAIAGFQWIDSSRRMAVGFGLPVKLDNSDSDFGAIFQFRLKLD
jgi:hypothetical protein